MAKSDKPIKYFKIYKDLSQDHIIQLIKNDCQEPKISGVYGFLNHITNKIYIGSAQNIFLRFKEHISYVKTNIRLKRSIKKYKLSSFSFIIFEIYVNNSNISLLDLETYYIQSFHKESLFNFKMHATSMVGYKHTKKAREKMSEINRGENHPLYGKSHSIEARKKISLATSGLNNPMFGKLHSDESKSLMAKAKSKGVVTVFDKNLNIVSSFDNASLVANWLGVNKTTIGRYIKSGKFYNNMYKFVRK